MSQLEHQRTFGALDPSAQTYGVSAAILLHLFHAAQINLDLRPKCPAELPRDHRKRHAAHGQNRKLLLLDCAELATQVPQRVQRRAQPLLLPWLELRDGALLQAGNGRVPRQPPRQIAAE